MNGTHMWDYRILCVAEMLKDNLSFSERNAPNLQRHQTCSQKDRCQV
jgi:hypothetical protein